MWKYSSNDANGNGTIEPEEITDIEYTHFDFELDGYTMKIYVEGIPYAEWTMRSGQYESIGDTLGLYLWSRWADYGNTGDEQFRMKDLVVKAGNVVGRQTISFDQPNTATMTVGQNLQLVVNEVAATFTSSDSNIASINSDGMLTAHKKGEAVITIVAGGQTTTCTVTITLDVSAVDNMITAINTFKTTIGVTDNPCGKEDNQPYVSTAADKAMNDAIAAAKLGVQSALTNEDVQKIVETLNDAYETFKSNLKFGEHTWDDGKITKEPTVDSAGERCFTCKECGATMTEKIKKIKASQTTPEDTSAIGSETTDAQDTSGCGCYVGFAGAALIAVASYCAVLVGRKKKNN